MVQVFLQVDGILEVLGNILSLEDYAHLVGIEVAAGLQGFAHWGQFVTETQDILAGKGKSSGMASFADWSAIPRGQRTLNSNGYLMGN